jgi:hypothetical protein
MFTASLPDRENNREWHGNCSTTSGKQDMKIAELAAATRTELVTPPADADAEVSRVYAADTISDLIAHASAGTLLVTHLDNPQLVRVAELMDAPAICLVGGTPPCRELLEAARRAGAAVLVARAGLAAAITAFEERLAR